MSSNTKFRPNMEPLDDRLVPAGNIAASIGGEVLELRGDEAANEVRISQNAAGTVVVEGLNGTTINGRTSISFDGSGLEKTDVLLFGGNDKLTINNLRVSVDQNVDVGSGNDVVTLTGARAGVNISVKTADGFDTVSARGVRTGGDFYIETGEGRSTTSVVDSVIGEALTVIGKNGADATFLSGVTTGEDLNVEAGEGNDRVELTDIGAGKNLKVDAGTGDDFVAVTNVYVASDAVFLGDDGFDTFRDRGVWAGQKLEIKEFNRFV